MRVRPTTSLALSLSLNAPNPLPPKRTKQGILFVTYSTSIGQSRGYGFEEGPTRVDQIVEWAGGGAFNGAWRGVGNA